MSGIPRSYYRNGLRRTALARDDVDVHAAHVLVPGDVLVEVLVTAPRTEIGLADPLIEILVFQKIENAGEGKQTIRVDEKHVVLSENTHVGGFAVSFHRGDRFGEIERATGDSCLAIGMKDDFGAGQAPWDRACPNYRLLRVRSRLFQWRGRWSPGEDRFRYRRGDPSNHSFRCGAGYHRPPNRQSR